jgi:hypothetical protein
MTMISEDRLRDLLKAYDNAVEWHSYSPHHVDRERAQHKAAAALADALRELLSLRTSPPPSGEAGEVTEVVGYVDRYVLSGIASNDAGCGTIYGKPMDQFSVPVFAALPTIKEPTDE